MGWLGSLAGDIGDFTGLSDVLNFAKGDPNSVKAAYDQAMQKAQGFGQGQNDFLMGQQQKALQRYAPIQQMFQGAYGTGGIQGPQMPQGPFGATFGGRR